MTEPMRLLYYHTLDSVFSSNLCTEKYHIQEMEVNRLSLALRRAIPADVLPQLEAYLHALEGQQLLELEAMFQAAFTLSRQLQ